MRIALIFMLLVCVLLTGCGARETDEVAWVITMGLDKADDGDLLVTYRIAIPNALAAGSEGGAGKETSTIETIKAPSLAESRNLLNTSLSRSVSLSHLTAIVIGEDLARSGVQDVLAPVMRFREYRGSIFLIVARGQAKEVFEKNKPKIETLVSRWVHNSMQSTKETSYFLPVNLHQFYTRLKSNSGAPLAVGYGINPLTGQDSGHDTPAGDKVKMYLPGDLPRQGGNPIEFVGAAVFKEDKLVGFLETEETRALSIVLDEFPRGFMVLNDPLSPQHSVNVNVRNGRTPKISVDISGEHPSINLDVFLEGEITAIPTGISYESTEYLTLLETQVSNVTHENIKNMLLRTQEWGADVVDFGYFIRPKFATLEELRNYGWDKQFHQATFTIQVHTELRRTGLMRKTTPIRREQGD